MEKKQKTKKEEECVGFFSGGSQIRESPSPASLSSLGSLKIDLSSLSRLKNDGSSINHTKVVKNRSGCYWKILQNTFSLCQLNLVREKGK